MVFFIIDSFGSFLKLIILISAGLIIFFYLIVKNEESLKRPEFPSGCITFFNRNVVNGFCK